MTVTRIAAKAGVSIATVSRVLNNSRPVDPSIAEKVHKAMKQLEMAAPGRMRRRSPVVDRQTTIAIVSMGQRYREWFALPVIASVVADLNRAAQEMQMCVLMAEMPNPQELHPVLRRSEVQGAIVFISSDTNLTTNDTALIRQHLPVVRVMGGQMCPTEIDHICPDHNAIGYVAGEYLLGMGLKQLAYLTTNPAWDFSKLRAQGFISVAEASGVTPTIYLQEEKPSPLGFYGRQVVAEKTLDALVARLARAKQGRIGLFVSRDAEADVVYRMLRSHGLEPGQDVVVVACDNESIRLSTLHPRPASIDLGTAEIAYHAVRRLSRRIQHKEEPASRILVNPKLIPGELPVS